MQADFNRMSNRTVEEKRALRLARGLRAVAATVIVGGIVIAALDTGPATELEMPHDAAADPIGRLVVGAPLPRAAPTAPASPASEPVLERIERNMEQHQSP